METLIIKLTLTHFIVVHSFIKGHQFPLDIVSIYYLSNSCLFFPQEITLNFFLLTLDTALVKIESQWQLFDDCSVSPLDTQKLKSELAGQFFVRLCVYVFI